MEYSILVLLTLVSFCAAQTTPDPFPTHCAVTQCAGGAECNYDTGVCDCATAGITVSDQICIEHDAGVTGCAGCDTTNSVADGGGGQSCLSATHCLCNAGFFGAACDKETIKVTCPGDNTIVLNIGPHWYSDRTMFDGIIYLSDTNDFTTDTLNAVPTECRYTADELKEKIIPTVGECNINVGVSTEGELNLYAYVQFHPNFRTSRDRVVSARCLTGGVVSGGDGLFTISDTQPGDRAPIESTTASEDASGITMSLLAMDRTKTGAERFSSITSPAIVVGTDLAVVLEGTAAFSVKTCWATNRVETDDNYDDKKSFYYMEDWCVPPAAAVLFNGPVEGGAVLADAAAAGATNAASTHALMSPINAFYFTGGVTNIMAVQCLVCIAGNACGGNTLTEPVCLNTLSSRTDQVDLTGLTLARRRRSNIVAEVQNTTIAVSIKVVDSTDQIDVGTNGGDKKGEAADCYSSTSVLLPIILLAGLLLITMVMTFFFCMKVTRYQDQQSVGHDNLSFKS